MATPNDSKINPSNDGNASGFALSPSIQNVLNKFGTSDTTAANLAKAVFEVHPEYAGGSVAKLNLSDTSSLHSPFVWIEKAKDLFSPVNIQYLEDGAKTLKLNERTDAIFHGRLLVIGLCLLEPFLKSQLESNDVFSKLVSELKEPIDVILSDEGRKMFGIQTEADLKDTVPNWQDDPLGNPEDDLLGRSAFARYLAKRIDAIPDDQGILGAYALHIYGPWGAGKSTILNFLRTELEKVRTTTIQGKEINKWVVVDFNAWREQHIQPPWWSLLDHIFKTTKSSLSLWDRVREYWWRLNTGRLQYIIPIIGLAWVLVLFVFPWLSSDVKDKTGVQQFGANAESISKLIALVTTIWGGIVAANRSLLFGASKAAQNYSEMTSDPTNKIRRRYNNLINRLEPRRVAVFIDDLDRCQSSYVVDLLEGMQTLFREAPVVFVVAADRSWLNACYEDVYTKLEPHINEPGKQLGILFLEKAFRFSTALPGIPTELKESYWDYLLKVRQDRSLKTDIAAAKQEAGKVVNKAQSETEVRQLVKDSGKRSFAEQRALREEAVVRLAAPEIVERIEHTLKPYAYLLEPNPRAMKLLVNTYSANRALAILSETEIEVHELALWTILSSRWPKLADYLAKNPNNPSNIFQQGNSELPADLRGFLSDTSIREILVGDPKHIPLNVDALKRCSQIRS